jgi:hypothetical protein
MVLFIQSNAFGQFMPAIWEPDFGTDLNLSDDSTSSVPFGTFSFPFAGIIYTGTDILDVSSNGFVSLGGSNGNDCCNGNVGAFLNDTFPRLSPLWGDIDPANTITDGVFVNTFNDDGDAADDRLVVTWDAQHWGSGEDVLFQLQLRESGVITFGYNGISDLDRDTLIGVGTGGGAPDPSEIDLTGSATLVGVNSYEFFELDFTDPNASFDLDFSNVVFSPIPATGQFVVTQVPGVIPEPTSFAVIALTSFASWTRRRRRGVVLG